MTRNGTVQLSYKLVLSCDGETLPETTTSGLLARSVEVPVALQVDNASLRQFWMAILNNNWVPVWTKFGDVKRLDPPVLVMLNAVPRKVVLFPLLGIRLATGAELQLVAPRGSETVPGLLTSPVYFSAHHLI